MRLKHSVRPFNERRADEVLGVAHDTRNRVDYLIAPGFVCRQSASAKYVLEGCFTEFKYRAEILQHLRMYDH